MGLYLVTAAEYKAYAGVSSTNLDAELAILIPKVSELVKSLCRQTFVDYVDTPKVDYFEGNTTYFMPTESPLITVTSLGYSADYGNTYVPLIEYTDYVVSKVDGSIKSIGLPFPYALNGYELTYTAGYPILPEDLKIAVLDLVKYYVKNDSAIHSNRAPGGNTVQIEYVTNTNLPAHIRRVLDLYTHSYA